MTRARPLLLQLAVLAAVALASCEPLTTLTAPTAAWLDESPLPADSGAVPGEEPPPAGDPAPAPTDSAAPAPADSAAPAPADSAAPAPADSAAPAPADSAAPAPAPADSAAPAPAPTDTVAPPPSEPTAGDLHVVQLGTPMKYRRVCSRIFPEGGVLENGPARLEFPRDAVEAGTDICMVVGGRDLEVTLEPFGLAFPQDARPKLRISYGHALVSGSSTLRIVYSDPFTNQIHGIQPTVLDAVALWLEALVDHFSTFAMASN